MFTSNDYFYPIHLHGGGHDEGGLINLVNGLLAFIETLIASDPSQWFSNLMPGIAGMENMHPLFVHFPIALLLSFFVIDLAGSIKNKAEWRQSASWFLYLGTLTAVLTALTGWLAAGNVQHGSDVHAIMERHELIGFTVAGLAIILSVWRRVLGERLQHMANILYLSVAGLAVTIMIVGADLGGMMVYRYGVNVATTPLPIGGYTHSHSDSHNHD